MNIALLRSPSDVPARRLFSVADLLRMIDAGVVSEDERIELVEGDLIVMAAKGYAHELIKGELVVAVARALPSDTHMGVEMSIQFADDSLLEPDLVIFRRSALQKTGENLSAITGGGLLLAIEVAVSSLSYDRGVKARLYARFGVHEFWVIDANERIAWVHTGPSGETWSSIVERGPDDTLTTPALPSFAVKLGEIA